MSHHAPVFVQTYDLCRWLLLRLDRATHAGPSAGSLAERLRTTMFDLLEQITLAIKGFDRNLAVEQADAALARLRVLGRLAQELELLDDAGGRYLAEQADEIGRQLGGWRRALDRVE